MENCDFCGIGERESHRVIRQTDHVTSFLSSPRLTICHALIVPNRHMTLPSQLDDAEILDMHREADRLTEAVLVGLALGVDRWVKTRPHVPEGVIKRDHLHMHVLPSNPGQPIYDQGIVWNTPDWRTLTPGETDFMLQLLR